MENAPTPINGSKNVITLTHDEILSPGVGNALNKLCSKELNIKSACALARIAKEFRKLYSDVQSDYRRWIIDEYFKKDEKGNVIPAKNEEGNLVPGQYILNEETKEYKAKLDDDTKKFMEIETQLGNFKKLNMEDLTSNTGLPVEVDANTMMQLTPFFDIN